MGGQARARRSRSEATEERVRNGTACAVGRFAPNALERNVSGSLDRTSWGVGEYRRWSGASSGRPCCCGGVGERYTGGGGDGSAGTAIDTRTVSTWRRIMSSIL